MEEGSWFDLGSYGEDLINWVFCGATKAICFVGRKLNEFLSSSIEGLLDLVPDFPFQVTVPEWFSSCVASANFWLPVTELYQMSVIYIGMYALIAPWRWVKRFFIG